MYFTFEQLELKKEPNKTGQLTRNQSTTEVLRR